VEYWYNVGLEAVVVILVFFFLEETGFTRPGGPVCPKLPEAFLPNRMATFFFTARVVPKQSTGKIVSGCYIQSIDTHLLNTFDSWLLPVLNSLSQLPHRQCCVVVSCLSLSDGLWRSIP
jgi:hypothetical protein